MKIYLSNVEEISEHNNLFEKGEVTYRKGVNQFTDMTIEEFKKFYSRPRSVRNLNVRVMKSLPLNIGKAPSYRNWIHEGAVTKVKNQGLCGSCWAFAVAALMEGHIYLKHKKLENLSPQNLVDCITIYSKGCCGGWESDALHYVKENGIATEQSYPYECRRKACTYARNDDDLARSIKDYKQVQPGNETALKQVVGLIGPVTCSMDATDLKSYKSGVFYRKTCVQDSPDHALLIVGYGTTKTKDDYWLVKNSWDTTWGEQGYIRVARGKNMCGVEVDNLYPIF